MAGTLRFGVFELDLDSGELRKAGRRTRLAEQPFHVLRILLQRAGSLVSREELQRQLWSADTFVDFELGLNSAVRKLRDALGDSAENPRFIETIPRRGYRFIAPVDAANVVPPIDAEPPRQRHRHMWTTAVAVVVVVTGMAFGAVQRNWRNTAAGEHSSGTANTVHPQAHDAYVKGLRASGLQTYEGFRTAVNYFEQATARQPDFARAYAALSEAQLQFLYAGPLSPREVVPKAEAAARKALQLQPDLPEAHRVFAAILHDFYWRFDESEQEYRRARQLGGDHDGRGDGGMALGALIRRGRIDEAIAAAERQRRMDPASLNANLAVARAYRAAGQYDRAAAEIRSVFQTPITRPRAHFQLGAMLATLGRFDDAIGELEIAVRSSSRASRFEAYLGYVYAASGRTKDARTILAGLESLATHQYVSSFGLALIHDALGEKELALAAFERAYRDRAVEFSQWSDLYPPFKTIASEPRFLAVVKEAGLN
jgi:DNA-binding winged helix-turn-helix (wHTH) protein/tetratricopeptide (TPR) repeat protein